MSDVMLSAELPRAPEPRRPQTLAIHGHELLIDPTGALWWAEERMLIVADLHLEKGSAQAARGYLLPPYDTQVTLNALAALQDYYRPRAVLALGDSFHDRRAGQRMARTDAERLDTLSASCDWIWIAGNHDREAPMALRGDWLAEWACGALFFRHEPTPAVTPGEVSGHLHPVAKIQVRGRNLRCRCVVSDGTRAILPAFGAYTGGLNLCDEAYAPIFARSAMKVWMLGDGAVYPIGWQMLIADGSRRQSRRKATLASQPQAIARKADTRP